MLRFGGAGADRRPVPHWKGVRRHIIIGIWLPPLSVAVAYRKIERGERGALSELPEYISDIPTD